MVSFNKVTTFASKHSDEKAVDASAVADKGFICFLTHFLPV